MVEYIICVNTNTKWQNILILDPVIQAENQNELQIIKADSFRRLTFLFLKELDP